MDFDPTALTAPQLKAARQLVGWGNAVWNSFNWGPAPGTVWNGFNWGGANWTGPVVAWSYFTLDNLGSVVAIADNSGTLLQAQSYDAWGKPRNVNGTAASCGTITSSTTRGFTNQEEMPAPCLINLNARVYDPSIGKFQAADPVVADPDMPNAFNRYAYANNAPTINVDPTGYDSACNTTTQSDGMTTVTVCAPPIPPSPTAYVLWAIGQLGSWTEAPTIQQAVTQQARSQGSPPANDGRSRCIPGLNTLGKGMQIGSTLGTAGSISAIVIGGVVGVLSAAADLPEGAALTGRIVQSGVEGLKVSGALGLLGGGVRSAANGNPAAVSASAAGAVVGGAVSNAMPGPAGDVAGALAGDKEEGSLSANAKSKGC